MSRDWTKEEIQAASAAMQSMGFPTYDEFCAELGQGNQPKASAFRYYFLAPHPSAKRIPAGYTRFERWDSKPFCRDVGQEVFGVVEYERALSQKEMTIHGLCGGKSLTTDLTT